MIEQAVNGLPILGIAANRIPVSFASEQLEREVMARRLETRKGMLGDFKRSAAFREDYSRLINVMSLPRSDEELAEIGHDFSGLFFEDMAHRYWSGIVAGLDGDLTLFSPEDTYQVYSTKFFLDANVSMYPTTGRRSLHGIVVPDGILVRSDGHVDAVLEYTAHGDNQYFKNKLKGFTKIKNTPGLEEIFSFSQLIFVTPTFVHNKPQGFDIREMPLVHKQLRDFVDHVFCDFRSDSDSATAMEIQRVVRSKLGDLLHKQPLTPEQRDYLQRVYAR